MPIGQPYGATAEQQLAPARARAAREKEAIESMERGRLQRENDRLQAAGDEAARLRPQQQLAETIRASLSQNMGAIEAALKPLQQPAAPARDLAKMTPLQLINAGLEDDARQRAAAIAALPPASTYPPPQVPAPAAPGGQDLSKLSPRQLIIAGLEEGRRNG